MSRQLPPTHPANASATTLQSPNGLYRIDVSDSGIVLRTPGVTLTLDASSLVVKAGAIQLRASGTADIHASLVQLNGNGSPVARRGDPVVNGAIAGGDPTVLAG
jgi:hypothetical protein